MSRGPVVSPPHPDPSKRRATEYQHYTKVVGKRLEHVAPRRGSIPTRSERVPFRRDFSSVKGKRGSR